MIYIVCNEKDFDKFLTESGLSRNCYNLIRADNNCNVFKDIE